MGGPQGSASAAADADGFVLVGGPQARAAPAARRTATTATTADGFELVSAAAPSGRGQALQDPATAQTAVDAAPADRTASPSAARRAVDPAAPAATPAAGRAGQPELEALAVLDPSSAGPSNDVQTATDAAAGAPRDGGGARITGFVLCLLAAGALWTWHRRYGQPRPGKSARAVLADILVQLKRGLPGADAPGGFGELAEP